MSLGRRGLSQSACKREEKKGMASRKQPVMEEEKTMNVLYEQGLEETAAELSMMGYDMHPLISRVPADAVLYVSDVRGALHSSAGTHGAPVLCVRGLSTGEIAAALRRRSVRALF